VSTNIHPDLIDQLQHPAQNEPDGQIQKKGTLMLNHTPPIAQHLSRPLIYYAD
jgi:hypothetical protein